MDHRGRADDWAATFLSANALPRSGRGIRRNANQSRRFQKDRGAAGENRAGQEIEFLPGENRHSSLDFFLPLKFSGMNAFWNFFGPLLGLGARPEELTFVQISLRGIIVFLATLIMIRLGHKRSLARKTAFDAVLIVILASVLSRAVNGSAAFFATLGGSFVIVMLHRLLAWCAFHSHRFGILIKGRPEVIIEDGDFVLSTMHRNHISTHDVEEDMRLSLRTDDVSKVKKGRVERSGDISFICR